MTKKLPRKALLIACIITALLAGTALAAKYVFSALNEREALPEATEALVDIGMAAFESDLVRYQPIDALVDGDKLIVTVEVSPIDPSKHLIANGWGEREYRLKTEDGLTWPEYAKAQGKTLVTADVAVNINGEATSGEMGDVYEGDKMLMTFDNDIPFKRDDPAQPLEVELVGYDRELYAVDFAAGAQDAGERRVTRSTITIRPKPVDGESLRFEGPFERKYVTVDWVTFDKSALSLAMTIQYTLHGDAPQEVLDALPEVRFALADPTGRKDFKTWEYDLLDWTSYPANADKYGDFGAPEMPPTNTYIAETIWPAIEEWPRAFELNLLYKGTGEWDAPLSLQPPQSAAIKP